MQKNTMIIGIIAILLASAVIVSAGADDVDATDGNQVVYTTDGTEGTLMFYIDGDIAQRPQINITFEDGSYLRLTGTVVEGGVSVSRESISDLDGTIEYTVYPLNGGSGDNYAQGTFNAGVIAFDGDGATGTMESVRAGGTFTLPDSGFEAPTGKEFGGWIVNGVGEPVAAGTTIEITGNMTLTAVWNDSGEPTQTTVSFEANGDGAFEITPEGPVTVNVGTSIIANGDTLTIGDYTVTAKAGENYEFSSWEYSGTSVTENMTITAVFTETVGPEPPELTGITVSGPSVRDYEVGETLNLEGLLVTAHYSNGGEDRTLSVGEYSVTPGDGAPALDQQYAESGRYTYTVSYEGETASFTVEVSDILWDITYSKAQNGSISGDSRVVNGGDADYTVRADYGYVIGTITVGGQPIEIESGLVSYNGTIERVSSDVQVTVTFEEDTASQTVTVNVSGDGGRVTPSGTVPVYDHWGAIIYVETDTGYEAIVSGSALYDEIDGTITIPAGSDITTISVEFVFTGSTGEDDVPPRPPVSIPEEDDSTTYIVAIAAAAVVAILAALILMQTRKSRRDPRGADPDADEEELTTEKKGLNASTN